MITAPLPRRAVLRTSAALAAPLALGGLWPRSSQAEPPAAVPARPFLTGRLAAWLVIEPDAGATLRIAQLDDTSQPAREVAAGRLASHETGISLQRVCQRAHETTLDIVARSWGVSTVECVAAPGRIAHAGQGRSVTYALWVDFA